MGIDKDTGKDRQARLYELTEPGLPTMFHDEERPRNVWTEQLALAERISAPGSPSIIPEFRAASRDVWSVRRRLGRRRFGVEYENFLNDGPLGQKMQLQ